MTATAHALVGVAIASSVHNPILAIPLALGSHVALDLVPHWDSGIGWRKKSTQRFFFESLVDLLIGFLLSYVVLSLLFPATSFIYALLIIICSQLPDWIMAPYLFLHINLFKWAYEFGSRTNRKMSLPWGLIVQLIIVIPVLLIAKSL